MSTLECLISPYPRSAFLREIWEKAPLHVGHGGRKNLGDVFGLDAADRLLAEAGSLRTAPDIQVVADGRRTTLAAVADRRTGDLEALYRQYRGGATVVFAGLQRRSAAVGRLARELSVELSARVNVNAYLTPPSSSGFPVHFDTHDVLVLQTSGTKRWRVYDPPERLPLRGQSWTGGDPADSGTPPVLEVDMREGDCLYLPRGFLHGARSMEATSLHLTIGIHAPSWGSVLVEAVQELVRRDPALRESLPPGFAGDPDVLAAAQDRLGDLGARLPLAAALAAAADRLPALQEPGLRGHLLDLTALRGLHAHTRVRRRVPGWRLATRDDVVELAFHGKIVSVPAVAAEEMRFIAGTEEFCPAALPGRLDDDSRLLLVRRLVAEGALAVVG